MILDAAFHRRVLRLYEDMLDQPTPDRAAWLEQCCADTPGLREAVQALVDAQAMAGLLPTTPASQPPTAADADDADTPDPVPQRIGPWRLRDRLGAGGMGVVYLAERADGLFDQRVAIKLMRRTALSARAQERFETERRILARLQHPHVARILDGGATEDARPYLVMELVDGLPILDHCARHRLGLADRLALFAQMAEAVGHAHRHLVVHADLTPANVAVAEGFGVKLLDFGIAGLLGAPPAEGSTGYTPGYASPARRAGLAPVPADDIFAAGRLLDALTAGVAGRDATLDAIVARATAADPDLRYESLRALTDDLDRWRARRPTVAARPDRLARLALFVRRHRLGVSLGALACACALVTCATIFALLVTSRHRLALAEARGIATRHFADYIINEVDPALARTSGTLALRRDLVEQTRSYLHGLESSGDSALLLDIAAGTLRTARIYGLDPSGGIGDLPAAHAALTHAESLMSRAEAAGVDPDRLLLLRGEAGLLRGSEVYLAPSRAAAEAAIVTLREAATAFRAYLAHHPDDPQARLGLWSAEALPERADLYLDRPLDGVAAVQAHLADGAMTVRTPAQRAERDFNLDGSLLLLGEAYAESDPQRAIGYLSELIADVDAARARGRSDWESDLTGNSALADRAELESELGHGDASVADFIRAVEGLSRLYLIEGNHEMGAYLAHTRAHLADQLSRLGRHDEARAASDGAIAWLQQDTDDAPGDASRSRILALALSARAVLEQRAGRRDAACAAATRAVTRWQALQAAHGAMPIDLAPATAPVPRTQAIVSQSCAPA